MTQALVRTNGSGPTPALVAQLWDEEQVRLLKQTICAKATDAEMSFFAQVCRRTALDPFARQIYFVKRADKMTIQTGIDGYRLIADRTGKYAGSDDPVFQGQVKGDQAKGDYPAQATVTVWKLVDGHRCPFTATARWTEYYPGDAQGAMWRKMPYTMLGKCAEALALRKAFPQDLSGLYTTEEMMQADAEPAREPVRVNPRTGEVVDVGQRVAGAMEQQASYAAAAPTVTQRVVSAMEREPSYQAAAVDQSGAPPVEEPVNAARKACRAKFNEVFGALNDAYRYAVEGVLLAYSRPLRSGDKQNWGVAEWNDLRARVEQVDDVPAVMSAADELLSASGADTPPARGPEPERALECSEGSCGRALTKGQHDVSLRAYGRPLCPGCQKQNQRITE